MKTKKQRIKEWEDKLDRIVADYKNLETNCDAAHAAGCLDIDGNLFKAIWVSHETLLKLSGQYEWISWFLYENEYGSKKLQAGCGGSLRKIKNTRDLAKLIVEDEDNESEL
jgi:hypothetical protein